MVDSCASGFGEVHGRAHAVDICRQAAQQWVFRSAEYLGCLGDGRIQRGALSLDGRRGVVTRELKKSLGFGALRGGQGKVAVRVALQSKIIAQQAICVMGNSFQLCCWKKG